MNRLTDEEIVKELINESNRGEWCELSFIDCVEVRVLKNAIDLIHRQKTEIERLTKEYERIAYNKQEYLEWVDGFLRTHTVMKDRGEDYKMFDREWMCNTFWAKIEGSIEYIIDLENQRNELQEQVDELKEERYYTEQDTAKEILTDLSEYYYDALDNTDCAARFDFWCRKYDVEVE